MKKQIGKPLMQKWKNKIGVRLSALDKKKLVLPDAIKNFGTYEVKVKLHPQVTAVLHVQVVEA
mgnify:FL=1